MSSARRQFGENPADTAIRKLNSDLYGYFDGAAIENLRKFCVPEHSEYFGGYLITFGADPLDLPENLVEDLLKHQKERAAVSDGEILFSETPKYWAGYDNFSLTKFSETDARVSVSPPSAQLHWLLSRERAPAFLNSVPTLFSAPIKPPQRQQQQQPQQPPQQPPQPTQFVKVTNRPYNLTEEALKVFFNPLNIEATKCFGRTIIVKFATEEEASKAYNADAMVGDGLDVVVLVLRCCKLQLLFLVFEFLCTDIQLVLWTKRTFAC